MSQSENRYELNGTIYYHNDLTDLSVQNLSATHANIFMVTCYRYQQDLNQRFKSMEELQSCIQEDIPYVDYNLTEFIKACNYKVGGPKKFAAEIKKVREKLGGISIDVHGEDEDIGFPFFYEFRTDRKAKTFRVQIHKRAAYMLFALKRNYTSHEIREFVEIKSIYAKRCYSQLKRWRTIGEWNVDIETFKRKLGVPKSYRTYDIDRNVIDVIQKQLDPYFEDLKVEKVYDTKHGNPIKRIIITFQKEVTKGARRTGFECPQCGGPLVEKKINGNVCWCHEDGWKKEAKCNAIFNSVAEIKGYDEKNNIETVMKRLGEIF